MKNFWYNLSQREQVLLILCAIVIVFFMLYIIILMPLSDSKKNSAQALEDEKARYERVLELATRVPNSSYQTNQATITDVSVRVAATEASKRIGIAIARIQPGRDDTVSFWIDAAKTEELFNWLILLDKEYGQQSQKILIQKNIDEDTLRGQFEFAGDVK